jgi:putative phage-type endonuclease
LAELEQRTPEWFDIRRGKVTASRIGDILKTIRNGNWAASRRNYAAQLVAERLTGQTHERFFTNEAMEWGKDQEPIARQLYCAKVGNVVTEIGFVDHPTIPMAGASPDGLVGNDGLLEIKCLIPANHQEVLLTGDIKDHYKLQMYWQMACTKRRWCDFVSYDPSLPEHMQLFIHRLEWNEAEISNLEMEVKIFLDEVAETVEFLQKTYVSEKD